MTTDLKTARVCVRCRDCLDVAFCDAPLVETYGGAKVVSAAFVAGLKGCPNGCGGKLELMGRVTAKRCYRETVAPACDARCTAATGPDCSCQCKGHNHGTGRTVTVLECGTAVPRGEPNAKALERAAEWRAARERCNALAAAAFGDVLERKARGEYVPDFGLFLKARSFRECVGRIAGLRTHAGRMRGMAETEATLRSLAPAGARS